MLAVELTGSGGVAVGSALGVTGSAGGAEADVSPSGSPPAVLEPVPECWADGTPAGAEAEDPVPGEVAPPVLAAPTGAAALPSDRGVADGEAPGAAPGVTCAPGD